VTYKPLVTECHTSIASGVGQPRLHDKLTELPRVVLQRVEAIYPELRETMVSVALSENEKLFC
jgi:hypothetical protein